MRTEGSRWLIGSFWARWREGSKLQGDNKTRSVGPTLRGSADSLKDLQDNLCQNRYK